MKLYKYRGCNQNTYDSLINQYIWCSNPFMFGDIYDCQPLRELYGSDSIDEKIVICSFSSTPTNNLLWDYYADGHKGICIEYDIPDKFPFLYRNESFPYFPVIQKVNYCSEPPELPNSFEYISNNDRRKLLYNCIFSKDTRYAFEKEIRFAFFLHQLKVESNIYKLPPWTISRIFLGSKISCENELSIMKSIRHLSVKVCQVGFRKSSYELTFLREFTPRPWLPQYFTPKEKEIAKIVDEIARNVSTEDLYNLSKESPKLARTINVDNSYSEFIEDRINTMIRFRNAIQRSYEVEKSVYNTLKDLENH